MRKKLKIFYFVVSAFYFFRWLLPVKINIDDLYINIGYGILAVPYLIYESIQLIKDDKKNKTHIFRNRIRMMGFAGVILVLTNVYLNYHYQPY